MRRDADGRLLALVVIEVDDLIVAEDPKYRDSFVERSTSRLKFGKWKVGESEYAGRRLRQQPDGRILVDQEKYILEQVRPMRLERERKREPTSLLTEVEIRTFRGIAAQIQWVARESRPDVAGSASLLNGCLPEPKVSDALMANKVATMLRSTATQYITLWPLDASTLTFVTLSDAGGPGTANRDGCQGAWLVVVADARVRQSQRARASILSWRSQRLKRVISSTLAAKTLSLSCAVAEAQWLQMLCEDQTGRRGSVHSRQCCQEIVSWPRRALLSPWWMRRARSIRYPRTLGGVEQIDETP